MCERNQTHTRAEDWCLCIFKMPCLLIRGYFYNRCSVCAWPLAVSDLFWYLFIYCATLVSHNPFWSVQVLGSAGVFQSCGAFVDQYGWRATAVSFYDLYSSRVQPHGRHYGNQHGLQMHKSSTIKMVTFSSIDCVVCLAVKTLLRKTYSPTHFY